MKKGWKIFWIVTALIAGMGIVFCGIALALGVTFSQIREIYPNGVKVVRGTVSSREDHADLDDVSETGEYYEFQNITGLEMDVGLCDVEILPSTDDMVRVDATNCWFGSDMSLVVKEDEGKLKIKTSRKRQILDVLSLIADDDVSGDLKIYLPADLRLDTAKLTFGASDVEIQALSADEVILKVGAADCSIKCMNVGTMRTDVGAGSVEMEGIIQGDLNVKCGAGDVEACLQAKESDYNYSIKSGAGDISIGGRDYNGLASVRNIDNGSEQDIEIICGAGEVEIEFEQRTYEDGHHDETGEYHDYWNEHHD